MRFAKTYKVFEDSSNLMKLLLSIEEYTRKSNRKIMRPAVKRTCALITLFDVTIS